MSQATRTRKVRTPHQGCKQVVVDARAHSNATAPRSADLAFCGFDERDRGPEYLQILFVIGGVFVVDLNPFPGALPALWLKGTDVALGKLEIGRGRSRKST